jgi:hypothetical protein
MEAKENMSTGQKTQVENYMSKFEYTFCLHSVFVINTLIICVHVLQIYIYIYIYIYICIVIKPTSVFLTIYNFLVR